MRARLLLLFLFALLFNNSKAQLIQGTIKPGATASQIEVWLKPDFSNSTQYLFQLGFPIAFPSTASPQPTGLTVTLDPGFTSSFGTNYAVSVNAIAQNTAGTEKYFNIVLIRGGAGASVAQTWTAGTEFKVLTATFTYSGSPATFLTKLADYQDAGSDGQGNFYTQDGNANYYVTTNSIGNFYSSPGNSVTGGTSLAGFVQLIGAAPVCQATTPGVSNITNNSAAITWTAVNDATGYEYAVTTSATPPASGTATAAVSFNATGLNPSTIYYVHVRTNCGSGNFSTWTTVSFTTTCTVPIVSPITGTTTVCAGSTTQLSSTTPGGVWSSNTALATVDANGLVTGVSGGSATISYAVTNACGTTTVSTIVTVNPLLSAGIASGTSPLCIGATATYSSDGASGGIWSSSNIAVATVNASTGAVTAVSAGTTTITYTLNSGCGTPTSASKLLTVNPTAAAGAVSGSTPLCIGANTTYTASGNTGGTWSSSNTAVATVNAGNGIVTAVATGTTNIIYTISTGCGSPVSASQSLTVITAPSVAAITGTTSTSIGATTQLASATPGGSWSSNNTGVATVNGSGLVTGVSAGSATISYAVTNTCGTTTVTATVSIGESLIQGTIKSGSASNEVEIWLKPNFSNSTKYLFQLGLPIAFPASANPQPTSLSITLDPGFVAAFGNNYTVTVNPVAQNTGGTEKYINVVLIRGGAGASDPQTWTAGNEFKVLTASFTPYSSPGTPVKLADYQDGGSDGQGNFYTQSSMNDYYTTNNSVANFYASPGQSITGGTATAGYAQTIATIGCAMPVVAPITGSSSICTGSTTQLSTTTPAGTWSSNNTSVATVSISGIVTAVAPGNATISYAVTNSCGTTTVTKLVTVNATYSNSATASACNSYTLPWGLTVNVSGTYSNTYASQAGCDSVVTYHVTISNSVSSSFNIATCDSYTLPWGGTVVTSGSLSHTYQTANGCDSTVTAHVTINNSTSSSFTATACDSYTLPWGGSVTTSGAYTHTYQTVNGCDSVVTAHITINNSASSSFTATACDSYTLPWSGSVTASGAYTHTYQTVNGCDSIVTANIIINHSSSSTTPVSVCANQLPYTWNGNTYNAAGTYTVHLVNAAGCDSAAILVLTVNSTLTSSATVSACNSYTLPWGGSVTTSGDYSHTYIAVGGCDSIVTYHVSIYNSTSSSFNATACDSYTLPWGGSVSASGDYVHTYQTVNGCDSVVTAHVTINHSSSSTTPVSICTNQLPYTWNGNIYNAAGTYTVHLVNAAGCDSAATLVLTVNSTLTSSATVSACDNYTLPWGSSVTTSGDYTHTYTSSGGCDSVVTYHVTINNSTSSSFNATACDSYTLPWGGSVSTSGIYTHTYQTIHGCDSIVTAHVTINTSSGSTTPVTICANELPYNWNGNNYNAAGTYTVHFTNAAGCDSAAMLVLSVNNNPVLTTTGISSACGGGSADLNTGITSSTAGLTVVFYADAALTTIISSTVSTPGTYYVQVTNAAGCSSSASITVIFSSSLTLTTTPLTMSCGTSSVNLNNGITSNTSGLTVTFYSDAALTNLIAAVVSSPGTYYVKATDGGSCFATASIVVTATDTQNPVITCSSNISTTTNSCTKNIATHKPAYSDNCSVASLTWVMSGATTGVSASSGINFVGTKVFNAGLTTVTYTAKDAAGNTATCSFTVRVTEGVRPSITCVPNITQNVAPGVCSKTITVANPVVNDNCVVASLTWAMSGATTGSSAQTGINYLGTQTFNTGTTTVSYSVKDASGNERNCSFTVRVVDNQDPNLVCPSNITDALSTGCSKTIAVPDPVYTDNCGVTRLIWFMTGATFGISPFNGINVVGTKTFNPGVTTIIYLVFDASNNITTCSFTVTVNDNSAPVITCPADITQSASNGKCEKSIKIANPVISDNCGISKLTWTMSGATSASSFPWGINYLGTKTFNAGITTVTYTVTGVSGNTSSCSFTVGVVSNASCGTTKGYITVNKIQVTAFPNPSEHYFNLQVVTQNREEITVRIMDISGRVVQQLRGAPEKTYRFGDGLMTGTYIVEVRQGSEVSTTKVIKQ